MGLVVVEHIDTGLRTLHVDTCTHAKRAIITHPGTPFWVAGVDHECKTCKPDPQEATDEP